MKTYNITITSSDNNETNYKDKVTVNVKACTLTKRHKQVKNLPAF